MAEWYWKNYRQKDNLAAFARFWDHWGLLLSLGLLFFLLAGLGTYLGTLYCCKGLVEEVSAPIVLAMLGGGCLGVSGLLYGGIAAASIAHTADRRMLALEQRILQLEGRPEDHEAA